MNLFLKYINHSLLYCKITEQEREKNKQPVIRKVDENTENEKNCVGRGERVSVVMVTVQWCH